MSKIQFGGFDPLVYYILTNDNYWGVTLDAIDDHIFAISTWDSSSENQIMIFAVQRAIVFGELPALYAQFRQYGGDCCIGIAVVSRDILLQPYQLPTAYRQQPFDLDLIVVEFESYGKYRHSMATFPFIERE